MSSIAEKPPTYMVNCIAPQTVRGDSLLHLVTGRVSSIHSRGYQAFNDRSNIFPDPITTDLLLKTGAAVEGTNQDGSTALHVASSRVNYREDIVTMLLRAGAHIDRTNHLGDRPNRMLEENQECKINVFDSITLKCLAATKLRSLKIKYAHQVSKTLTTFIDMH